MGCSSSIELELKNPWRIAGGYASDSEIEMGEAGEHDGVKAGKNYLVGYSVY